MQLMLRRCPVHRADMEVGGVEVTTDGPEVLDELGITEAVDAHPDVSSAVVHGVTEDLRDADLARPFWLVLDARQPEREHRRGPIRPRIRTSIRPYSGVIASGSAAPRVPSVRRETAVRQRCPTGPGKQPDWMHDTRRARHACPDTTVVDRRGCSGEAARRASPTSPPTRPVSSSAAGSEAPTRQDRATPVKRSSSSLRCRSTNRIPCPGTRTTDGVSAAAACW
jgi:hypothetical protein